MSKILKLAVPLGWALIMTGFAQGGAYYQSYITGTLEFRDIRLRSTVDSASLDQFAITVDPTFMDPTLHVVERSSQNGYGDYSSGSAASLSVSAEDFFNIGVGDSITVVALASGSADRTVESSASSSAFVEGSVFFANNSAEEVAVQATWFSSLTRYSVADYSEGENAGSFIDMDPAPAGDLVTWLVDYQIPAGEVQELRFSAEASGSAFAPAAVPEPAAILIWVIGLAVVGLQRLVKLQR